MRTYALAAVTAASLLLAACGGGSSTPAVPAPAATTKPSTQSSGTAVFVVKIPPKLTNAARTPKYLTASVQAIEFSVTQNNVSAGYAFYPLSSSQTYCSTPAGGGLTCTLPVVALPGNDTIVVNTYDQPNNFSANLISTGSVPATINAKQSNTISIVTSGIPTFFAMSVDNPYPTGVATQALHVLALDADANVIVGPYDVPITFTNSDKSGAVTLSATSAASSTAASALSLAFSGAAVTGGATITVQANSPAAVQNNGSTPGAVFVNPAGIGVTAAPSYLLFSNASAAAQTFTAGGLGTTAPYMADTNLDIFGDFGIQVTGIYYWNYENGCQNIASVTASGSSFTVTPVHAGICYLNLSDSAGHHGALPVIVQSL